MPFIALGIVAIVAFGIFGPPAALSFVISLLAFGVGLCGSLLALLVLYIFAPWRAPFAGKLLTYSEFCRLTDLARDERNAILRRLLRQHDSALYRKADWLERLTHMERIPAYHINVTRLDHDAEHGTLYQMNGMHGAKRRLLVVRCPSTFQKHILFTPSNIRTACEARAWTFGMTKEEFAPEAET